MPVQDLSKAAILLAGVFLASLTASAQAPPPRGVLSIHWGAEDFPGTSELDATIREVLIEAGTPVNYYAEYLETETFPVETASLALRDYIRRKYAGRPIDLVIANTTPVLRFVLQHRAELFPDVPIVFTAAPRSDVTLPRTGVTGVLTNAPFAETVDLALQLHPAVKRVFVIGRAPTAEGYEDVLRRSLQEVSQRVPLTFISEPSWAGLAAAVKAIPPDSVIFYTRYTLEDAGRIVYSDEVARRLVQASPAPIYVPTELYMGLGVVGGVMRRIHTTGTQVGDMARQILDGVRPEAIPIQNVGVAPIFDWRQVERWSIDPSRLPPGSDLRFKTPTVWETYRRYIVGTIIVIAAQLLLIAALLVQRARRHRAEEMIRRSEATVRRSYERIRQLAGRLINAQESARAGLAQDLHDDVCQHLVYLSMSVSALKSTPGRIEDTEPQRAFTELEHDTRCVLDSIRRLSHELHPSTLRVLGLGPALKAHCLEVEKRHGVQVAFTSDNDLRRLNQDIAVCLFRTAQESLRNAIVHGDAKRLAVTLASSASHVELTVADDGRGFDLELVRREAAGLGLVTMEERVNVIGGEVRIVSEVGRGTTVRVRCPLEPPPAARVSAAPAAVATGGLAGDAART